MAPPTSITPATADATIGYPQDLVETRGGQIRSVDMGGFLRRVLGDIDVLTLYPRGAGFKFTEANNPVANAVDRKFMGNAGMLSGQFGTWVKDMAGLTYDFLLMSHGDQESFADRFLTAAMHLVGVTDALRTEGVAYKHHAFNPQAFNLKTIRKGGFVQGGEQITTETTIAEIKTGRIRGQKVSVEGLMGQLLDCFDPEKTMWDVIQAVRRLSINPRSDKIGYTPGFVEPTEDMRGGEYLRGGRAIARLSTMREVGGQSSYISKLFLERAAKVHTEVGDSPRKLTSKVDSKPKVVWTSASEIAIPAVEGLVQGGLDLVVTSRKIEKAEVAAALTLLQVAKKQGVTDGEVGLGAIVVSALDLMNPGRSLATMRELLPDFGYAIVVDGLYDHGWKLPLLLLAQFGLIKQFNAERGHKISGTVHFQSPSVPKEVPVHVAKMGRAKTVLDLTTERSRYFRNDIASFQKLAYQVGQFIKYLSARAEKALGLRADIQPAPIVATKSLMNRVIQKAALMAPRAYHAMAVHPRVAGTLATYGIVLDQHLIPSRGLSYSDPLDRAYDFGVRTRGVYLDRIFNDLYLRASFGKVAGIVGEPILRIWKGMDAIVDHLQDDGMPLTRKTPIGRGAVGLAFKDAGVNSLSDLPLEALLFVLPEDARRYLPNEIRLPVMLTGMAAVQKAVFRSKTPMTSMAHGVAAFMVPAIVTSMALDAVGKTTGIGSLEANQLANNLVTPFVATLATRAILALPGGRFIGGLSTAIGYLLLVDSVVGAGTGLVESNRVAENMDTHRLNKQLWVEKLAKDGGLIGTVAPVLSSLTYVVSKGMDDGTLQDSVNRSKATYSEVAQNKVKSMVAQAKDQGKELDEIIWEQRNNDPTMSNDLLLTLARTADANQYVALAQFGKAFDYSAHVTGTRRMQVVDNQAEADLMKRII